MLRGTVVTGNLKGSYKRTFRSQASFNQELVANWSQRRRDFSRGVSGMNSMWNNGEKNVILATAKVHFNLYSESFLNSIQPAKMTNNIQDLIAKFSRKYNQDPRFYRSKELPRD